MAGTTSCNPCDTGVTSLADKSVAFQDILNPLYAEGRVLETWGQYEEFLRYETIFFDVVPQKDPVTWEVYVTYKFKDGLASSAELTLVDNDCKVGKEYNLTTKFVHWVIVVEWLSHAQLLRPHGL